MRHHLAVPCVRLLASGCILLLSSCTSVEPLPMAPVTQYVTNLMVRTNEVHMTNSANFTPDFTWSLRYPFPTEGTAPETVLRLRHPDLRPTSLVIYKIDQWSVFEGHEMRITVAWVQSNLYVSAGALVFYNPNPEYLRSNYIHEIKVFGTPDP